MKDCISEFLKMTSSVSARKIDELAAAFLVANPGLDPNEIVHCEQTTHEGYKTWFEPREDDILLRNTLSENKLLRENIAKLRADLKMIAWSNDTVWQSQYAKEVLEKGNG